MSTATRKTLLVVLPTVALVACVAAWGFLFTLAPTDPAATARRVPREYIPLVAAQVAAASNPGTLTPGTGHPAPFPPAAPQPTSPSSAPPSWPCFRGANHDGIAISTRPIAESWPAEGPPVLWRIPVGEGHAGAAICNGCVYLVDYDRDKQEDAIRCLSLDTGEEIWRYSYSVVVLRNHGMSRTVPYVDDRYVVAMGPKCHLTCLNSQTGELVWQHDLVKEYGTKVPLWYAAQCPLVENGRVIVAPGANPLVMALDLATGEPIWKTNVPDITGMSHASIVPFDFQGRRQYVYLAREAVVGVAADTGEILWTHPTWKGLTAAVAGPVPVGDGRLFLCAGYGVGSIMLRLVAEGATIRAEELYRLTEPQFGSEQHTPIFYKGDLYGAQPRPKGEMVCMDLDGKRRWSSGTAARFEIGPYLIVNDLIVALDGASGTLCLAKAAPVGYTELTRAKVLSGHDAWAPMAFVEGRLVLRDLTEMICVDLGGH